MALHQTGYNYHPGDPIWLRDLATSSFKPGRLYQVETRLFKKPDNSLGKKLTYLVVLDGSANTLRVNDSDLYYENLAGEIVPSPPEFRYNIIYNFAPDENLWVIDRANNGVRWAKTYQTEIKIHKDTDAPSHAKITYLVKYNDNTGTVKAAEDEVFEDATAAWAAIGITLGPTPTPTLPPEATPVPGGSTTTVSKINGDNVVLHAGMPVYIKQINGTVARVADDVTSLTFLGFVYDELIGVGSSGRIITEGTVTASSSQWNNIIDVGGTLSPGVRYYLAATGKLTATPPSEPGTYMKQVGMAVSTTEMDIRFGPAIKL